MATSGNQFSLQIIEALILIVTQCIFSVIIYTMYQLRLKLELINSTASVDVKVYELRRKTKLSFLIGVIVVVFYSACVVYGVVLET